MQWGVRVQCFHLRLNACCLAPVAFIAPGCTATQEQSLIIRAKQIDEIAAAGSDDKPPLRGQVERGAPAIIIENPDSDAELRTPSESPPIF